jgi:uncharacterized protein YeaO (DUF488 family)
MAIKIKRIYDPAAVEDGYRVLVDRVWPRGVRREEAAIDLWLKDAAPSVELRRWFGHRPELWPEFRQRYFRELEAQKEVLAPLLEEAEKRTVTLLYGAKEERFNNAAALREFLEEERSG